MIFDKKSKISSKIMIFQFNFLINKFHLNTLKSLWNFKTLQLKIFSIIIDFKLIYEMSNSISVDFK